jgi:hypothetical protein
MAFCLFIEIKFKSGINGQEPYPGRPTNYRVLEKKRRAFKARVISKDSFINF